MTEGFQARGQSVAHGQCARMDDPAESVSVQGDGQRDDGRGEEGLAGWGDPGAAETASSCALTIRDDRRQVGGGRGGVGQEGGGQVEG